MTISTIINLTILLIFTLAFTFGRHAMNGHVDGKVDAQFRDSLLDNTMMQRDEPRPERKWRHALYVHFYKKGWAKQLAQEKFLEERVRQGIRPIMRDNSGWDPRDPGTWDENLGQHKTE